MNDADPHLRFIEQIDLSLDGELDASQAAALQAHLRDCDRCRRALMLHQQLRAQLGTDSPVVSDGLESRIKRALSRASAPHGPTASVGLWGGWAVAATVALAWTLTALWPRPVLPPAPMVQSAVADFEQHIAAPFPQTDLVSLQSQMPFPIAPLQALKPNLIAAWHTRIRGQPVGALAYRVRDRIVVEYIVSQNLFFHQARVREAIAKEGRYLAHAQGLNVVAWPDHHNGILLVGPVDRHILESFADPVVF